MPETTPSLYDDLRAAGIPTDNHESDLYCLATPQARALIERHGYKNVTTFRNNIDGRFWLDVPFAYAPFWDNVARIARGRTTTTPQE